MPHRSDNESGIVIPQQEDEIVRVLLRLQAIA
jgi:hypothetical protein